MSTSPDLDSRRNNLRNECRTHARDFDPSLGFANVSEWMRSVDGEDRCGYSTLAVGVNREVRRRPPPRLGRATFATVAQPLPHLPRALPHLHYSPCEHTQLAIGRFRDG